MSPIVWLSVRLVAWALLVLGVAWESGPVTAVFAAGAAVQLEWLGYHQRRWPP